MGTYAKLGRTSQCQDFWRTAKTSGLLLYRPRILSYIADSISLATYVVFIRRWVCQHLRECYIETGYCLPLDYLVIACLSGAGGE